MLRATELRGKKGARNVAKYLAEYYNQDAEIMPPGEWIGAAAEKLNLNDPGRDLKADIEAVIQGKDPSTGERLTKARGERLGYDLTFSDEKDFSILAATATPGLRKAIIAAHVEAVKETLAEGLPLVVGRWGKGGTHKEQADAPVRLVHHMDSRAGDPQLHTHALLPNLCRAGDRWLTIEAAELKKAEKALGAIFREKMAQKVEALGFTVERVRETGQGDRATGEVWHRVAGITDEVRAHFSKRDAEITATAEAEGISRDLAAQKTRQHKTEQNSATAVIENAQAWLRENGHDLKADDLKSRAREPAAFTPKNRAEVLASLHDHESSFSVWDFVAAEAKEGRTYGSKEKALDALMNGRDCHRTPDGERFISFAQYDLETGITLAALARKDVGHKLDATLVADAIDAHELKSRFQLSPDQRAAVEHVCAGGGVSLIGGRAGTGKSATAGTYMGAFEAAGYDVVSVSTATKAANNLERETERPASNFAQLIQRLDSGKTKLTDRSVVVIDEAGMVSARDWAAVQKHADAAGAKIIAIGDEKQLQPVGAGTPFRDLLAELEPAGLSNIRRQRGEAERAISVAFYEGKTGEQIVSAWEAGGMLTTHADRDDARAALVAGYNSNPAKPADKLIIVHTHADATAINNTIRQQRQQAGELGEERAVRAWVDGGKAEAEIRLAVGDRVRFTANGRGQYVNGEAGEVVGWGQDTIRIKLETDDRNRNGQIIELQDVGKPLDVVPGYAQTLHTSQGQGAESVYYLPGQNVDRNTAMVGHTRTKGDFHMYAAEQDREQIAEGVDGWRYKVSARELMAGAAAVGAADAQAQQQHEQRLAVEQQQAREAEGARARAAQEAAQEAKGKELGAFAVKEWNRWKMDDRHGAQRTDAEASITAAVWKQANELFPAPTPTPTALDEAMNGAVGAQFHKWKENEEQAAVRLERANDALRAADARIKPEDLARVNKLDTLAEAQRASKDKAHEKAESLDFRLFGGDWLPGQYEKGSLTEKQAKTAKRFLETGKWGLFNKPGPEQREQAAALLAAREAEQRRAARVEAAEREAREIRERIAPDVSAAKQALAEQVRARETDKSAKEGTQRAWRQVVASVPEVREHAQKIEAMVRGNIEGIRKQQYARDQVLAEQRKIEQAKAAAYEREHAHEQSRGYGGMSM